jgi:glycosyltransferase involved in cell wall biosynthesis
LAGKIFSMNSKLRFHLLINSLYRRLAKIAPAPAAKSGSDFANLIRLSYQVALGRPVEPDILALRVDKLTSGTSFADMFAEIARSEEAAQYAQKVARLLNEDNPAPAPVPIESGSIDLWRSIVEAAYKQLLRRPATESDVEFWINQIKEGLSIARFFQIIAGSDEANNLPPGPRLGSAETDGEFLVHGGALLYGRGLLPQELTYWQGVIQEIPERREYFSFDRINDYLQVTRANNPQDDLHDASSCQIMGTTRILTKKSWDEKSKELAARLQDPNSSKHRPVSRLRPFEHSGSFKVSMIASLYKGGKFIRQFLDNITSQSIFEFAELIIIDANSPENEHEIINDYRQRFPNIVYKQCNYRIGIYEAWNLGVEMARGCYLTNTNLDDLRRYDSISVQSALLDENEDVDVVYQDFYYTLDSSLTFDDIADYNFKSELPIVTAHNLLAFNSPHNAPMWRVSLHDELGKFDTRYRSAGDYEFWTRCLAKGKRFRKLNCPHVAYYQNPEGISTRPDTRGIEEARDILRRYSAKLISPALLQSRRDFRVSLGLQATSDTMVGDISYYDLAQTALLSLGSSRRVAKTPPLVENAVSCVSGASTS